MSDTLAAKVRLTLPLKSVAGALMFSVAFGPIGLLYASTIGGAIMTFLLVTVATYLGVGMNVMPTLIKLWLISCVWSVVAVNRYNKKLLRQQLG